MWILWTKSLTIPEPAPAPNLVFHHSHSPSFLFHVFFVLLSLKFNIISLRRIQVKLKRQALIYSVMSAILLFFVQITHFRILISNIVTIRLPTQCNFYFPSSGLQPCRHYTSSTYLLNCVSRCLKASAIQMSLLSSRNFISSVIEKAMYGTVVILKMLLQQLCHKNNLFNVCLTLQHVTLFEVLTLSGRRSKDILQISQRERKLMGRTSLDLWKSKKSPSYS